MIFMTSRELKEHLGNLTGCVTFEYNGYSCGVDPISHNDFNMWYGDKEMKANSIDEVMETNFFDGKKLDEIVNNVLYLEW